MRHFKVALTVFLTILFTTGIAFAESAERPWLGVFIQDPETAGAVLISDVVPGGPADLAGLSPADLIIGLNGEPISGSDDLVKGIMGLKAGDSVALKVDSGGNVEEIAVTLEPMPVAMAEHGRGYSHDYDNGDAQEGSSWGTKGHGRCKDMRGHGEKCMNGMGMMEDGIYGKMYSMLKALRLDPAQTAKMRMIDADFRKKTARARAELEVAEIELGELMEANPVSLDKVKTKLVEISTKKADLSFLAIKAGEDVKKLLTPEQLSSIEGGESCPLGARHGKGD